MNVKVHVLFFLLHKDYLYYNKTRIKKEENMKKNNKGFIAISLIYSFFLVFLATLLMNAADYAQNRILLNDVKKETQKFLDSLAEFNPISIENKKYDVGDEITYAYETWQVLENNDDSIIVMLNRSLNETELSKALKAKGIDNTDTKTGNKVLMCLNKIDTSKNLCQFSSGTFQSSLYYYTNSIASHIVTYWYNNNATLQKATSLNKIQRQGVIETVNYNTNQYNVIDRVVINNAKYIYITNKSNFKQISESDIIVGKLGTNENEIISLASGIEHNNAIAKYNEKKYKDFIRYFNAGDLDGTGEEYKIRNTYIRIPTYDEYSTIDNNDIWYLTGKNTNNWDPTGVESYTRSFIKIGTDEIETYTTKKEIRPVITIKKG